MKKIPFMVKLIGSILLVIIVTFAASNMSVKPQIIASGDLVLKSGLEDYASANKTMFLVIYSQDPAKPMPLAIVKEPVNVTSSGKIRKFSITPDKLQRMMSNDPIPKVFKLKARLDRDGLGGPDKPGDITAVLNNVEFGREDVQINFDTKI
jgi:hypothetical protein